MLEKILQNSAIKKIWIESAQLLNELPRLENYETAWLDYTSFLKKLEGHCGNKKLSEELEGKVLDLVMLGRDVYFQIGFGIGVRMLTDANKIYEGLVE